MPSRITTRWLPPSSGASPPPRAEESESSPPCRVLAVNVEDAVANPSYRPWSKVPITFSRADQWVDIPYIGCFPLVLDATVQKVLFRKVLVDGGSALNLLFVGALKELGLGLLDLTPSDSSFWGVVPSRASKPLGEITLPV